MQRRFGVGIGVLGALLVVLIGAVGGVSAADSCAEISGPAVIDQSGCYVINESAADSSADVHVEIRSSNVILEGAGHTIDGSDGSGTIGVYVNGSAAARLRNVTVRNLTVTDWETGLYYDASDDGAVVNVTAISNTEYGLHFDGVTTVAVEEATTDGQSGLYDAGTRIDGGSGVEVSGLESTNDDYGIYIYQGSGHTIRDSTFTGDAGVIVIDAQQVTVRDSFFEETAPSVDIDDSGDVLVDNNTVVDGSLGVLSGSNGPMNRITNNEIDESSRYATGADCYGMSIDGAADDLVANNTWTQCNSGVHIDDSERIEFGNNTITGTDGGNSDYGLWVSGGADNEIIDNEIEGNGVYPRRAGILLGTHKATLSGNTLAGNGFNLEIGTGGNWSSISHTIDATNTVEGRPVAYHVNETDVTVDPNAGWVGLVGTQNAVIDDVAFAQNNRRDVMMRYADDTVIRNVDATPSWVAVSTRDGSDRTRIADSRFDGGEGLSLREGTGATVVNTTVTNSDGHGFLLSEAPDTTFENVTVTGNDWYGIRVRNGEFGTVRVTVANSRIADNNWGGIDLYRAAQSVVRDSVVRNNDGPGLRAQRYFDDAVIAGNEITGNNGDGVTIDNEAEDTLIVDNTITDNAQNGIELGWNGFNGTIHGNVLTGNDVGIDLPDPYDNLSVSDNHFDNTRNVVFDDPAGVTNATWNASATAGTNVVGGATIGGNYWANQSGTGFSETCTDRGDGICTAAYTFETGHVDQLPLVAPDTGTAPASFDVVIESSNSPVAATETLAVNATIENVGDVSATQSITLDLDGVDVDDRSVTLEGGNSTTISLSYVTGDADVGQHIANVSSANVTDSVLVEVQNADDGDSTSDVTVNSITVANGTVPHTTPFVEAWLDDQSMLQLNLRSSEHGGYDLENNGVDRTTEFEIDLTVENVEPRLLLGAGNVTSWERTPNGTTANATDLVIRVRPVETQAIWECDGNGTCTTPDLDDWPDGGSDTATDRTNVTVSMAVDDLHAYPTGQRALLDGAIVTTDAQLFGDPVYTQAAGDQPATLSLRVGGPHYTVDGAVNTGYYETFLPDALLSAWNVTEPDQLTAAYQGTQSTLDARTAAGGMLVSLDVHYSAGTVEISASTTDDSSDDGSDGGDGNDGNDGGSSGGGSNSSPPADDGDGDDGDDAADEMNDGEADDTEDGSNGGDSDDADGSDDGTEGEDGDGTTGDDADGDTDEANETDDTNDETVPEDDSDGTPGFGAPVGMVALLIALAARVRAR
ncbi:right-handed parallel beta-helix repeat-containing protein [Natrinema salaciae]|uniref:PGF-CTERM protein n=1 Tax=Natrinema salaciae TaxID=1186196 RepID=A0A1H9QD16_9EURY|nr:right-handed parallel beta-helix repeat-containing protein [Natrinema salaciae]SER58310.1 PGF-CTERM protein [Natrinema salaciae]